MATHKVLVYKETGNLGNCETYEMDAHRPEPPDMSYIPLEENNPIYIDKVLGQDIGTIAYSKSHYDFANNVFVWGHNDPNSITVADIIPKRNFELAKSDHAFANCKTQEEIDAWVLYRQKLRDLPEDLKDARGQDVKLPRDPNEIALLKICAANGDLDAQRNIEEEGL